MFGVAVIVGVGIDISIGIGIVGKFLRCRVEIYRETFRIKEAKIFV